MGLLVGCLERRTGQECHIPQIAAHQPKCSALGPQEGLLFPTPPPAAGKVAPECRLRGRQLPCQPAGSSCERQSTGGQGSFGACWRLTLALQTPQREGRPSLTASAGASPLPVGLPCQGVEPPPSVSSVEKASRASLRLSFSRGGEVTAAPLLPAALHRASRPPSSASRCTPRRGQSPPRSRRPPGSAPCGPSPPSCAG